MSEWTLRHQLFQTVATLQSDLRALRDRDQELLHHLQALDSAATRQETLQDDVATRTAVHEANMRTLEQRTLQVIERHLRWLEQGTVWCPPPRAE